MGLATVIIKTEGKPPDPYMQGHPLMNFRGGKWRAELTFMMGRLMGISYLST